MKLKELGAISVNCGLSSSASKTHQIEALKSFYYKDVLEFYTNCHKSILSLDLGLCNLALCEVEALDFFGCCDKKIVPTFRVLKWNKFDLRLPEIYNPSNYACSVRVFVQNEIRSLFTGRDIFIERQRYRSGSNSAILETIIRLAILEAQLHCFLSESFKVTSINPVAVARYHSLPTGKEKKSAAVALVKELLKVGRIIIPSNLKDFFMNQKKQDDLADCLLQAIAVYEFRRNCKKFIEEHGLKDSEDIAESLG